MVKYLAVSRGPWAAMVACAGLTCFFSNASCQNARADSLAATGGQYELLYTIKIAAKNFTTDKLQNVYLLTPENEVIKYTPDGKEQFRYPNKTLGDVACLDATNPFHLLLFFPQHQTVLTLDRTMNLSGRFNLLQFGLFQVNAVGMASDGRLWAYDEVDFRLKKMDADGTVMAEGSDLSLVLGQALRPNFLVEKGQLVYLNVPDQGILVFDIFGQYQKTLPLKGLKEFHVFDDQLIYFSEGKLNSFHLKALLERSIMLPENVSPGDQVKVENERLYVLSPEDLKVYKF